MTAPPPQWGAPQWGPPQGDTPQWGPPPSAPAPRPVLGTVSAHLVLWLGLLGVALAYRPLSRLLIIHVDLPYQVLSAVLSVFQLLPVAVALVIAGRSATLRWAGALGAVAVLAGAVVLAVIRFQGFVYPFPSALAVLALGTWIGVRRHAVTGHLVLLPAAVLAVVWFGPPGRALRQFPYDHGFGTLALVLWNDLPIVALAVLGLVSSLLRPRPAPGRDAAAVAVIGGLLLVVVVAGVVAAVG